MTPSEVRAAARQLVSLHSRFAPLFGRKEACAQSLVYLRGLLGAEGPALPRSATFALGNEL